MITFGKSSGIFGDKNMGLWFIRLGRMVFILKAPWREAYFSERMRMGILRIPLGFGWRIVIKRDEKQDWEWKK